MLFVEIQNIFLYIIYPIDLYNPCLVNRYRILLSINGAKCIQEAVC